MRHLWLPVTLFLALLLLAAALPSSNPPVANDAGRKSEEQKGKRNEPEKASKKQTAQSPVPTVIQDVGGNRSQTPKGEKTTQADKRLWWWPPSPEWVVVFITLFYAIMSFFQWREIRRQATISADGVKVSQAAVEASTRSADVAEDSLVIVERAWLSVIFADPFRPQPRPFSPIQYTVKNVGRSVAFLKDKKINAIKWNSGPIPKRRMEPKPIGVLPTIAAMFPGDTLTLDGRVDISFSQQEVMEANSGRLMFDVYGYVAYDDVFGTRHLTRFCRVYDPMGYGGHGGFTYPREAQPEYNDAN